MILPAILGATKRSSAAPVTWNPADKDASITLSGGNLIATSTAAAAWASLRTTLAPSPPTKAYFRAAVTTVNNMYCGPGIASVSAPLNNFIGSDTQGIVGIAKAASPSLIFYGGSQIGGFPNLVTSLDYVVVAFDSTAKLAWFTVMTAAGALDTNWDSVGDSPATGTGGFPISTPIGTLYPAGSLFDIGVALTLDVTTVISDTTLSGFSPYGV